MIQIAVILSKEGEMLLASTFADSSLDDQAFQEALPLIKDAGEKLDEGTLIPTTDELLILVSKTKDIPVAFLFTKQLSKSALQSWKAVAKEIGTKFAHVYEESINDQERLAKFKKTMDEIIQWHLKENPPISKMREAFW
ncbi:MAG: hypothetical protein GF308_12845 [Candidatus Heimdallarchaeota archaeon]|nr:hypothetical protein [Candidatus Heimdallarchaeota archaeon]